MSYSMIICAGWWCRPMCTWINCTFQKRIEILLKSCEIMFCQEYASERSNAHDQGTAVQHWTEGSSADLKVSRPETWCDAYILLNYSQLLSTTLDYSRLLTILDYLSYVYLSHSFVSNANRLQSFALCSALCSEYPTVPDCLVSFECPALFTALKSLPCTELSSCEAKRPKDRRQVLMQLLRKAETVRDSTSTGTQGWNSRDVRSICSGFAIHAPPRH